MLSWIPLLVEFYTSIYRFEIGLFAIALLIPMPIVISIFWPLKKASRADYQERLRFYEKAYSVHKEYRRI